VPTLNSAAVVVLALPGRSKIDGTGVTGYIPADRGIGFIVADLARSGWWPAGAYRSGRRLGLGVFVTKARERPMLGDRPTRRVCFS
jgi:hypothetical protein